MRNTIGLGFEEMNAHLENISDGLNNNPANQFTVRVAHVLTCTTMIDQDKLNCIRVLYRQMAWPERELNDYEKQLLENIK